MTVVKANSDLTITVVFCSLGLNWIEVGDLSELAIFVKQASGWQAIRRLRRRSNAILDLQQFSASS